MQLLAPLYSVYTSRRLRFFGSRHGAEWNRAEQSRAGHTFPYGTKMERKRIQSGQRSIERRPFPRSIHFRPNFKANRVIFYRLRRRGGKRSLFFGSYAAFRLLFAAHDPSPLLFLPRKERTKVVHSSPSGTCLVTETFSLPRRRVNDRLVKIEKSLAGCLSELLRDSSSTRRVAHLPASRDSDRERDSINEPADRAPGKFPR